MKRPAGIWLIFSFTTEGSYQQDLERPAQGASDTQQFWITGSEAWDIRTFAIDKDLRILDLDISEFSEDPVAYFEAIAQKTYGPIIKALYQLEIPNGAIDEDLVSKVVELGLFPNAKWTVLDFPLWLPEAAEYASRGDD